MLIEALMVLTFALPVDSVMGTLSVAPSRAADTGKNWVLLDSAGIAIETGSMPAIIERDLAKGVLTICGETATVQLQVTLTTLNSDSKIEGTSHCFRFGLVRGRMILHAVFDPRTSSLPDENTGGFAGLEQA